MIDAFKDYLDFTTCTRKFIFINAKLSNAQRFIKRIALRNY